ncbi:hypothetical protein COU17_02400 [Candidatus Kaiserbacteria bacterium CG10_big_fil_rev_8_21_14_0_10_49_17]|uniref:SHS2 domain-containing protein n=1 Tax=Candidatus Kaiserbacteria bacterium CG10_big_fil_rev_8_21_14_0_10_49_17 TaxID=1974609 RepID=A0A2M6WE43_9BACT|nr:MAG: hypothetical protein COU17_02400 [Candidatus Kaiserbacteria bacterium CG10_big_fil_rev_8_21_14_0_10_49_17]
MEIFSRTHSQRLWDAFPVPNFLKMPAAGVDISDNSVKVLALHEGGVRMYGSRSIADGIVSNGEILDTASLAKVLTALKRKLGFTYVRVALPEEKAFSFQTRIGIGKNDAERRKLIEFQLEENVPLDPAESVFDYTIIGEPDEAHLDVAVTVFPKKIIDQYYAAFNQARLVPISFELEAQAIARAAIPRGSKGVYMLVDFGRKRTGIAVTQGDVVIFTTTVDVGGDALTDVIMREYKVKDQEAEKIKNEQGFMSGGDKKFEETVLGTVSALRDEINRHFSFWDSRVRKEEKGNRIKKLLLVGGNSNLEGLPEYLAMSVHVPVERANVWGNVLSFDDTIPPIDKAHSLGLVTVIGLALSSEI